MQVLVADWVPPPQVDEHELQLDQFDQPPLIGHAWVLQSWDLVEEPWQSAPPFCGAGLVQVLVADWVPPPQFEEHELHADQSDQPPSIGLLMHTWDALQDWPVEHVPQVPVQPSEPQVLPVQFGVQTGVLLTVTVGELEQLVLAVAEPI